MAKSRGEFRLEGGPGVPLLLPLAGRDDDLAELRRHQDRAAAGGGGMVLLGGEAGVGKTALLHELARTAGPVAVATGRCPGPGETPPFGPWLEAVAELAAVAGVGPDPLPAPFGSAPGAGNTPDAAGALAGWLASLGRPALVALEDMHWADPASLEMLRFLTPRLGRMPVLVIATYRSDELHRTHPLWPVLPDLQRMGAARHLLDRLSADAVAELTAATLPGLATAPDLAGRVHRRTGGHALFVRGLLEAAARTGTPEDVLSTLPETVQQTIDRSLARLSPDAQSVLQAAAVVGERFAYDLLAQVADVGEDELLAALEEAVALHVIRPFGAAGDQFAFDHALVREALANRIIGPRRRRWHLRIAESLLAAAQQDLDLIALHLDRAGDPRAADYLIQAGDRSLHLGALTQAEQLYDRALERLPGGDGRRGTLLLKLCRALQYADADRVHACAAEAERVAGAAGDRVVAAWARAYMAFGMLRRSDPGCIGLMERARSEQEQLLNDPRYLELERDLIGFNAGYAQIAPIYGRALARLGRLDEAREIYQALMAHNPQGPAAFGVEHLAGFLAAFTGRWAEYGRGDASDLSAIHRAVNDLLEAHQWRFAVDSAVHDLWWAMTVHADRPDPLDDLAARVPELEAQARLRSGYGVTAHEGYSPLGFYQFWRGEWDAARRNLIEYFQRERPEFAPWSRWYGAELQLALGDPGGALVTLAPLPPARPEDDPGFIDVFLQIGTHCQRAEVLLALGRPAEARAWLESADRWVALRHCGARRSWLDLAWARLHRAEGNLEPAWAAAERGLARAVESLDFPARMVAHRLSGELAALLGWPGTGEHFRAAADLAGRCRFPYEQALAQLAWGRALPGDPGTREALAAARDTFARLGAAPALAEAERLLAGVPGPAAPAGASAGLTEREREVVRLVGQGLTDREVAARMYISPRTVDGHLRNIFNKVGVSSRAALVAYAARQGLL